MLHNVLIGGKFVPHEINVEAEQMAQQGCGEQAQKNEKGSKGQDGRSLGLHRGSRQEYKMLVGAKAHRIDKELHEDISGHQHQKQDTQ